MAFDVSGPTRVEDWVGGGYESPGQLWPFILNRRWTMLYIEDNDHMGAKPPAIGCMTQDGSDFCSCGVVDQHILDMVSDLEIIDYLKPGIG